MKIFVSLLSLLLGNLLIAQESAKTVDGKPQHPAVTTLIAWAESHQKDSQKEKVEIFSPNENTILRAMGKQGEVEKRMTTFVLSKKDQLSFKASSDDSPEGVILIKNQRFLPMKKKDAKWMGNLTAMMKGIKLSATISTAENEIVAFKSLLQMYRNVGGHFPSEAQGLSALFKKPSTPPRPRRWVQALATKEDLLDPWSNAYHYKLVEGQPIITSLGPDGKVSEDDLSSE